MFAQHIDWSMFQFSLGVLSVINVEKWKSIKKKRMDINISTGYILKASTIVT